MSRPHRGPGRWPKESPPGKRVRELYVFVAVDADGDEGIPAFSGGDGLLYPLVCADGARVPALRTIAARIARHTGRRIVLYRFAGPRERLAAFGPEAPDEAAP